MSNLWDEDEDEQQLQHEYSGQELGTLEPDQLVTFEANKRINIIGTTIKFSRDLQSCEAIVAAAYRVADYVPPFQSDAQSEFWKNKVCISSFNE